jgi:hypothetical protein
MDAITSGVANNGIISVVAASITTGFHHLLNQKEDMQAIWVGAKLLNMCYRRHESLHDQQDSRRAVLYCAWEA